MFDKKLFLHHTKNTTSHNKMTRAGVKAPFSVNEQAIPMNVSTNVTRAVATAYPETTRRASGSNSTLVDRVQVANQQERDAAAPEVKEKLQTDALKRVTSSPEYASASEEERTKMLERGLQSIGDDPVATSNQFTSPAERDAAYSTSQDTRSQNIDQDIQSQMAGLSDEERMLPPSELRRRGLIGSRYTGTAVSQGRPANPADPFGAQVSGPEDRPADPINNATRRESGPSAPGTQELFAAQDDLSQLRQDIRTRRTQRQRESDALMRVATADTDLLGRSVKRDDEGNPIKMTQDQVYDTVYQQGRGDHVGTGVRSDALNKYYQQRYVGRYNADGTRKGFSAQ